MAPMGAAMADNLRLRVVLDLVDRVLSPLKRISAGGTETARALKAAKDQLKQLNAQQAAVTNVQTQAAEFQRLNNQLKQRQALLAGMRASGDASRTAMAREENAVAKLTAALKQQREAAGEAAAYVRPEARGEVLAALENALEDVSWRRTMQERERRRAELERLAAEQLAAAQAQGEKLAGVTVAIKIGRAHV